MRLFHSLNLLKDSSNNCLKSKTVTNTKVSGALTVREMDSDTACARMAKLCTKGTGVMA